MFEGGLFFIGFILSIILLIFNFSAFFRGKLGVRGFVFWTLLSVALGVFSLFPGLIDAVSGLVSVRARGLLVLTVGLVAAYLLIYASYVGQRSTEKTVQRLSQEVGLLRYRLEYNVTKKEDHAHGRDDLGSE